MIQVDKLTKYFGATCAVDQISFEVKKGEIVGLLGPNGAGKTTTLRILTCYMQPSSGNVKLKDYNIYDHPLKIKNQIGYLPESAPLYPEMLVYDYLRFVADVRGLKGEKQFLRIKELALLCGLNEIMHKSIHELSKGYKQRVGLAHAMMSNPEILVLDEPTSGLDPNQISEIREIIKAIGKEKTILLSTHILSEADATCNRVIIINRGKIVADGATEDIKKDTSDEYIVNVSLQFTDFNSVKKSLDAIPEVNEVVLTNSKSDGIEISLKCVNKKDVRPEIYEIIKKNDWPLLEFYKKTKTLEKTFQELTKEF
jgi:ABC-2 type transport system ATP-binding protein